MKTVVDAIIVVILLIFLISGIRRGLIRQVLQIVGIVAAFIGAFYLAHYLARHLGARFDVEYRTAMVALQKLVHITPLGSLDRIGGAVFGLIKGALILSLICIIALSLPLPADVKDDLARDPLVAAIYPILPVLFNLIVSHAPAALTFTSSVDRVVRDGALITAKHAVDGVKTKVQGDAE
jgi:membrane protein required for colicin V production